MTLDNTLMDTPSRMFVKARMSVNEMMYMASTMLPPVQEIMHRQPMAHATSEMPIRMRSLTCITSHHACACTPALAVHCPQHGMPSNTKQVDLGKTTSP